jgi:hypothetical protein
MLFTYSYHVCGTFSKRSWETMSLTYSSHVYSSFSNIMKDVFSYNFSMLFSVSIGYVQRTDNIICQV